MKKIVSFLLIVVLVISLVPTSLVYAYDMGKKDQACTISAGMANSMFISEDGKLYSWGYNGWGALGDGSGANQKSPVLIMTNVRSVTTGSQNGFAIKTDNTLWAWGSNVYHALGHNVSNTEELLPVKVLDDVLAVSSGESHTMVIKQDGSLWAWGWNERGQLGNGTKDNSFVPIKIMDGVTAVSAGRDYTLAIKNDGTLWAWGGNACGQLGIDTDTHNVLSPVQVMEHIVAVSCAKGGYSSFAISDDGALWSWGTYNNYGELGNGTTQGSTTPQKILDNVESVSAGGTFSLAVKRDSTLWGWGFSQYGQLGIATTTIIKTPRKIMENVASVSAGQYHAIIAKTDHSVWTLGKNEDGQLGNGTTKDSSSPVQVFPNNIQGPNSGSPSSPSQDNNGTTTVPGDAYTVKQGYSGDVYATLQNPSGKQGQYYTWTSSNPSIVSFDGYGKTSSSTGLEPILDMDDPNTVQVHCRFYGISPGTATLTCTLNDGSASVTRQVNVVAQDSTQRTIKDNYYDVPTYEESNDDASINQIYSYWYEWYDAYDKYLDAIQNAMDRDASNEKKIFDKSIQEQAQAMMNAEDRPGNSSYISFPYGFPKNWKIYCYQALCSALFETTDAKIDLSKVDFTNTFSASSGIVTKIAQGLMSVRNTYAFKDVAIDLSFTSYYGAPFGVISCTGIEKGKSKTYNAITICSPLKSTKQLVADYLNELKMLEYQATSNVYSTLAKDLLGQPLSKLTEKYLSLKMQKFGAKLAELKLGNVLKVLSACNKYATAFERIRNRLKTLTASDIQAILNGSDISDETVSDSVAKKAVKALINAQDKLNYALTEYITTGTVTPPKKGWLDGFWSLFKCPINVSVYSNGKLVGYAGRDDFWYDDSTIQMDKQGEAVGIYSGEGSNVSFVAEGNAPGSMSYTIEQYENGEPTGRLNYYDLPLESGTSYSVKLSSNDLASQRQSLAIKSNGNGTVYYADEYIPVCVSASVTISAISANQGGTVFGGGEYVRGDAVVLYAIPQEDFLFMGWYDETGSLVSVSDVYEFTAREDKQVRALFAQLSDEDSQLDIEFTDCPSQNYTDVDRNAWYHESVDYAISQKLMEGVGNNQFSPNSAVTRAQVVTILWNREGKHKVNDVLLFSDVKQGSWYTEPIRWAVKQAVAAGVGNNKFAPNDNVTREEIAVFLYNYVVKYKRISASKKANLVQATDVDKISGWAKTAMEWAVGNKIINGTSTTNLTLEPQAFATRAEIATMVKNLCEKVLKE